MFLLLLVITLLVALGVSVTVAHLFTAPLETILNRVIADEISSAWSAYLKFAILVVGVSSGVRFQELEKYVTPLRWDKEGKMPDLTFERWVLEIYRAAIESLQGIAWMLLVFFLFALLAYVIVRITEFKLGERKKS